MDSVFPNGFPYVPRHLLSSPSVFVINFVIKLSSKIIDAMTDSLNIVLDTTMCIILALVQGESFKGLCCFFYLCSHIVLNNDT